MKIFKKLFRLLSVLFVWVSLSLGIFCQQSAFAEDESENYDAILKVLPQSKISLADGIRQAAQGTATPISAKFELDDQGKLSLSIYTVEVGLVANRGESVFKELSGSPESTTWNPSTEVIKDDGDLSHAKKQLSVLSKTKVTLLSITTRAMKDYQGTIWAVYPQTKANKSFFEVKIAKDGKVSRHYYDVITGNEIK